MERPKPRRSQNPLKGSSSLNRRYSLFHLFSSGKSIFLESDVKRSANYKDLQKHLTFLGAKIEEYLTPSISFVVTKDHTKCNMTANDFASPTGVKSPTKSSLFESRAQRQLRMAREIEKSKLSKNRKVHIIPAVSFEC